MSIKPNILFLSSWYPNRVVPNLGNFVQKHAEASALYADIKALYVCSDENNTNKYEVVQSVINNVYTVNVYYKKVKHAVPLVSQFQKLFRYYKAHQIGLKYFNERSVKIDLIHLNILYPAGIFALFLNILYKIPFIITENWTGYLPSKNVKTGFTQSFISKLIAKKASIITTVSYDLKNAMINKGLKGNYEIVYNVVNMSVFYPNAKSLIPSKIRFLHVSTLLDAHKNISGMLQAIKKLSEQRQDFEFLIIGDGDYKHYEKTSEQLGILNKFVFFEGEKTTYQIAEIMCNSNCFVLFSNYENLPCVMIEALASGIPVIATRVGGISEHLNDTNGIVINPKSEIELLTAMNTIIENIKSEKYDSIKISEYAKENFSYERIGERFYNLYLSIIERSKPLS